MEKYELFHTVAIALSFKTIIDGTLSFGENLSNG